MMVLLVVALAAVTSHSAASSAFTFTDITMDAGGWVTGMAVHTESGRVMARTDVGGVSACSPFMNSVNTLE